MRKLTLALPIVLSLMAPSALRAKGFPLLAGVDKESIILRWVIPEGGYPAGGFNLYRQEAGRKTWTKLNPSPLVKITDEKVLKERLGDEVFKRVINLISPRPMEFKDKRRRKVEEENRRSALLLYADISPQVADVLGLRWEDKTVEKGKSYRYRLTAIGAKGKEKRLATILKPIGLKDYLPLTAPLGFFVQAGDGVVSFRWFKEPRFSAYDLYRSDQKDGKYERVNTAPIIILTTTDTTGMEVVPEFVFTDSQVKNGHTYWYYLRGIDAFGRQSRQSERLSATPVDLTPPLAPLGLKTEVSGDTVTLRWERSPEPDAAGYNVYRGRDYRGEFHRINKKPLPREQTIYQESGLPLGISLWYYITAFDSSGNESGKSYVALANVIDDLPPAPPVGLKAISRPGEVILSWKPNKEEDLNGYVVFRSLKREAKQYLRLTDRPVYDTTYVDKLTKEASNPFYYRIKALDNNYNESQPSQVVEVTLPDVTPPTAPIFKGVTSSDGSVTLHWYPNPERDIGGYNLYRQSDGDTNWGKLNPTPLPPEATSFTDRGVRPNVLYRYTLEALDRAKNVSPRSQPIAGKPYDKTPPQVPQKVKVAPNPEDTSLIISWERAKDESLLGYVIFRSIRKKGKFLQISPLIKGEPRFVDKEVSPGVKYYYKLRAYDSSGNRSSFSKVCKGEIEKEKR